MSEIKTSEKRPTWSSNISFIIAALGSAVGLGNIWRFPYVMGQNGGAIFLLVYLLLIVFICSIPMLAEFLIGSQSRKGVFGAYNFAAPKSQNLAWLCVLSAVVILGFYCVVGGWIINYIFIHGINIIPADPSQYFSDFIAKPIIPLIFGFIFLALTVFFPLSGVNKGIEKANNIMMPTFLVMLIFLAITSLTLPDSHKGLEFMFTPDFSKFNLKMILIALGQALFTLSVGMGAIVTYGSYLKKGTNLLKSCACIIAGDTTVALLAGVMIFPAVFSFSLMPDAGSGLVFITLPQVFSSLPCGSIFALLFFILLFFAALTSSISVLETAIAGLAEKFQLSRKQAVLVTAGIVFALMIPASWSFGMISGLKVFDMTFFDLLDFTASNLLLPINTIIICILVGWFLKPGIVQLSSKPLFNNVFKFMIRYVIIPLLFAVLLFGLGII
jgi:NSS family neurotransmitter:Na+ symporter